MYIFGKLKKIDGTLVDGVTTVISAMRENENGIIFTASSYLDEYENIVIGVTVPFRAWDYFCSGKDQEKEKCAYQYLMTQEEFESSSLID